MAPKSPREVSLELVYARHRGMSTAPPQFALCSVLISQEEDEFQDQIEHEQGIGRARRRGGKDKDFHFCLGATHISPPPASHHIINLRERKCGVEMRFPGYLLLSSSVFSSMPGVEIPQPAQARPAKTKAQAAFPLLPSFLFFPDNKGHRQRQAKPTRAGAQKNRIRTGIGLFFSSRRKVKIRLVFSMRPISRIHKLFGRDRAREVFFTGIITLV